MRQIWLGCILLSTAVSSAAVTLGRYSGAAVIGRPLDIRIQALLGPGEDMGNLCLQPDVFYGDAQVPPAVVRASTQRSTPDAEVSVRIQASLPINEPVVTVHVQAGCSAPFSRRYVLLADPLSEPAASSIAPAQGGSVLPGRVLPPATLPSDAVSGPGEIPARGVGAGSQSAAQALRQPAARPARPTAPPSVVRRPASPSRASQPRLQLDPLDLSLNVERDPVLKLSLSLLSEPAATEEARAAAGLLWRAINASPEDVLRDTQKLAVLEAESKGLREQEARNQATIQELQSTLEASQAQRFMNWLVYLLGALLLLALLGLLLMWRRRTQGDALSKAWWAAAAAEQEAVADPEPVGGLRKKKDKAQAGAKGDDLDIDLNLDRESAFDGYQPLHQARDAGGVPPMAAKDKRDFAPSALGVSRSVATEELFDVQQQADFFVSLGEHEQAIQVLNAHLRESQEPSALAYLDLFKLYHALGRRNEYERLRGEFNQLFNADAPPFNQYSDESRGLEAYETAFSRIQALWPQPKVLEVIERSIFRDQADGDGEVFDLDAYRELLLLHAIAKEMNKHELAGERGGADVSDFQHTAIRPLRAAGNQALAQAVASERESSRQTRPMEQMPPASPRLGLDVDLSELSEFSAFEASLPEVAVPVEPAVPTPAQMAKSADDLPSNLIDFEVLDFTTPEEESISKKKPG